MKTMMTEQSGTHSVDIHELRVAQQLKRATRNQSYALPAEIEKNDIPWGLIFRVAASILGIFVFFAALFLIILIFGSQF